MAASKIVKLNGHKLTTDKITQKLNNILYSINILESTKPVVVWPNQNKEKWNL